MPGDVLPRIALVAAGEDRAGVGPAIQPGEVAAVTTQPLAEHGEGAGLLRQPRPLWLPQGPGDA